MGVYGSPAAAAPVIGSMEGSESGAVVPSDLEAETWVKIWNFPAEFLFADDISLLVSSFGSVVGTDEETYEKMQNHLRPSNLRRKLHSSTTFVTIFVRVSVTKPLPSRVAVGSKKGREFIIGLDFDPTPKVCLLCHGAGHFDFECCGTDKDSVEIIAEAGVGFEEVNDVAVEDVGTATSKVSLGDPPVLEVVPPLLPPAPCVSGAADLHAEVGDLVAVQPISVLEVPPSVEDVLEVSPLCLPPASCAFVAANMGELEAVQNIYNKHHKWHDKSEAGEGCLDVNARCADCSDGFRADFNGEQGAALMGDPPAASCDIGAAAAPELMPLLPATEHGVQGTLISEGSGSFEDPPVLVVDPLFLPPAPGIVGAAASDLLPEGTVFTQGSVSCEDFPVLEVDPPFLPPAPCTFGAAVSVLQPEVGELAAVLTTSDGLDVTSAVEKVAAADIQAEVGDLVAVQTISDGFDDTSTGERAAVLEVVPLLPCCDIGPVDFQDVDCLHGFCASIVGVHGAGIIDGAECYEFSPVIEAELDEKFHNIEQVFSVVICPINHHKWRDKSDVLGLDDQGLFSVDVLVMWLISRLDFGYAAARCWIFCLWMLISFRF